MIGTSDNPALKRQTISAMLLNAVANQREVRQPRRSRLGRCAQLLTGGSSTRRRGGSNATSGGVLQFNGDWGFVMLWAGKLIAPYKGTKLLLRTFPL